MRKCPDPKPRRKRTSIFFIVGCKWGVSFSPEEEAWRLLLEVGSLSCLFLFFLFIWCSTPLYIPTPVFSSIFQRLDLLKKAGSLREEAGRLETEDQVLEMGGLGKVEAAVAGSEVEGFYGLLRGAMLHSSRSSVPPPHKKICHTHLPPSPIHPQESTGPEVPKPADQAMKYASPAVLPASEEAIPANMQPLCFQLGVSSEYTSARLRATKRVHQPHMPPSAHMYARCTSGWDWCVPHVANLSSTWIHSSIIRRAILMCKEGGLSKLQGTIKRLDGAI